MENRQVYLGQGDGALHRFLIHNFFRYNNSSLRDPTRMAFAFAAAGAGAAGAGVVDSSYMGDLPQDAEAGIAMTEWLKKADVALADAEVHRQAAVALGTEIQRGADGRGFVINNSPNPPMVPPYIKWDPLMVTPYESICAVADRDPVWNDVNHDAQHIIETTLGETTCGTMANGNYVAPTRDVCRITNSRKLNFVRKRYNDVRGQMNRSVRTANELRYLVMYVMIRTRRQLWAGVLRPIPRYVPHRQTEDDAADQGRAQERYKRWMKAIAHRHGRVNAPIPEPGVARVP